MFKDMHIALENCLRIQQTSWYGADLLSGAKGVGDEHFWLAIDKVV